MTIPLDYTTELIGAGAIAGAIGFSLRTPIEYYFKQRFKRFEINQQAFITSSTNIENSFEPLLSTYFEYLTVIRVADEAPFIVEQLANEVTRFTLDADRQLTAAYKIFKENKRALPNPLNKKINAYFCHLHLVMHSKKERMKYTREGLEKELNKRALAIANRFRKIIGSV